MKWLLMQLAKLGYYKQYNGIIIDEKQLLTILPNGKLLIEKLLDNKINFIISSFKSEIIAKLLFEKDRFDLLVNGNLSVLLSVPSYCFKSYLVNILERIKSKAIKFNLNYISKDNCTVNELASFYLTIAELDMMEYIDDLSKEDLLKDYNGKTLLDELLNMDKKLTIDKVIPYKVKSEMEIAVILKSKNINQENIDIPLEAPDFAKDYLVDYQNKRGIGPLQNEGELLLNELYELFSSDGKSDHDLVFALVSGYRQALFVNYELTIKELEALIKAKIKNSKEFVYLKNSKDGESFSARDGSIKSNEIIIQVILHETGHALHFYLSNLKCSSEYTQMKEKIKRDPNVLKRVEAFSEKYGKTSDAVYSISEKKYEDLFDKYFTESKIKELDAFLRKSIAEKKEEFKSLGLPDETLNTILDNIFACDEYIEQQKRIIIARFSNYMFESEFGDLWAIADILDAIYDGELCSGILKNENGQNMRRTAGHGISYYSYIDYDFIETIANFSSLLKRPNSAQALDLLKSIVGEEFYNLLYNFYYNNIIMSDSKQRK